MKIQQCNLQPLRVSLSCMHLHRAACVAGGSDITMLPLCTGFAGDTQETSRAVGHSAAAAVLLRVRNL